jgi:hypothetical protein
MGSREDTIPHVGKHRAEGRKVPDVFPSFVLDLERKPPGLGKEIPEPNISPGTSAVRLGHFYSICLLVVYLGHTLAEGSTWPHPWPSRGRRCLRGCPEIPFLGRWSTNRRLPEGQNPHKTGTLVNRKGLATIQIAVRVPI